MATFEITKILLPPGITQPITVSLYYKEYYAADYILIATGVPVALDGTISTSPGYSFTFDPTHSYMIKAVNELCSYVYVQPVLSMSPPPPPEPFNGAFITFFSSKVLATSNLSDNIVFGDPAFANILVVAYVDPKVAFPSARFVMRDSTGVKPDYPFSFKSASFGVPVAELASTLDYTGYDHIVLQGSSDNIVGLDYLEVPFSVPLAGTPPVYYGGLMNAASTISTLTIAAHLLIGGYAAQKGTLIGVVDINFAGYEWLTANSNGTGLSLLTPSSDTITPTHGQIVTHANGSVGFAALTTGKYTGLLYNILLSGSGLTTFNGENFYNISPGLTKKYWTFLPLVANP